MIEKPKEKRKSDLSFFLVFFHVFQDIAFVEKRREDTDHCGIGDVCEKGLQGRKERAGKEAD